MSAAAFETMNAGLHPGGLLCIAILVIAYLGVLTEEQTNLRKSKPMLLGAGLIWVIIGLMAPSLGVDYEQVRSAIFHGLEEYAGLLLFLLVAMTYISVLEERNVFATLKAKMITAGFNYRQIFWATGVCAFFISSVADNLTTALVFGAIVMAVGGRNARFAPLACINVVCAANAGGAFSPFGDITTLMVWQAQKLEFFEFFVLFIPSAVNFLVPAVFMSFFIPQDKPDPLKESVSIKRGGKIAIALGFLTIATAVTLEQTMRLPPFVGMMLGLSFLMMTAWFIAHVGKNRDASFNIFKNMESTEWDTLLFFFGVIFSISGISYLGYLGYVSSSLYVEWGPGITNIAIGLFSAIIDNIPLMFAVLTMNPEMDHFQWLLITLTTGVGGSLLSIGSAAGVALMGVARGQYTFFRHLKWTPVLLLGYAAAIAVHYWLNSHLMDVPING